MLSFFSKLVFTFMLRSIFSKNNIFSEGSFRNPHWQSRQYICLTVTVWSNVFSSCCLPVQSASKRVWLMAVYYSEIWSLDWLWLTLVILSLQLFSVLKLLTGFTANLIEWNKSSKHFLKVTDGLAIKVCWCCSKVRCIMYTIKCLKRMMWWLLWMFNSFFKNNL